MEDDPMKTLVKDIVIFFGGATTLLVVYALLAQDHQAVADLKVKSVIYDQMAIDIAVIRQQVKDMHDRIPRAGK